MGMGKYLRENFIWPVLILGYAAMLTLVLIGVSGRPETWHFGLYTLVPMVIFLMRLSYVTGAARAERKTLNEWLKDNQERRRFNLGRN